MGEYVGTVRMDIQRSDARRLAFHNTTQYALFECLSCAALST